MAMICPYCEIEISESSVEAESGCCPECGSIITASSLFGDQKDNDSDDYEEDEFDLDKELSE